MPKLAFVNGILMFSKNIMTYSKKIAISLAKVTGDIFVECVLMNKDILDMSLYYVSPSSYDDYTEIGTSENAGYWIITQAFLSYEKRNRLNEYDDIISSLIKKHLNESFKTNHDMLCLLKKADSLSRVAKCPYILYKKIIATEIKEVLGGTLKFEEAYVKQIELFIRKSSNCDITRRGSPERLVAGSTRFFSTPSFLTLYMRSLFRRIILQGPGIIISLTNERYPESRLLDHFREEFGRSTEFEKISDLVENLRVNDELFKRYRLESEKDEIVFEPLVFERQKVPHLFLENTGETVELPKGLSARWESFVNFYKEENKHGSLQKLSPAYNLQHCEVDTPYTLPNGESLTLELTLFQTCVLSLFNEISNLTFKELQNQLKLSVATLQLVLKSFIDIGILYLEDEQYNLRETFSPPLKRVRNGKLRVPLPRLREDLASRTNSSSSTVYTSHTEGLSSQWKQELLKACIVRTLKQASDGLRYDALFDDIKKQISGFSIGEFKDALYDVVNDKFISVVNDVYNY